MSTVIFGTEAVATAVTSLAPSLAIPPASYFPPTLKPEIFCKNNNGNRDRNEHGVLRHGSGGDGGHQLATVFGDSARFILPPDHEAGNILQEQQRNSPLARKLDEVSALQRTLRKQHSVIGQYGDRDTPDVRK